MTSYWQTRIRLRFFFQFYKKCYLPMYYAIRKSLRTWNVLAQLHKISTCHKHFHFVAKKWIWQKKIEVAMHMAQERLHFYATLLQRINFCDKMRLFSQIRIPNLNHFRRKLSQKIDRVIISSETSFYLNGNTWLKNGSYS